MAADIQEPAFSQRSIMLDRPKLPSGTEVEVRSVEEGFQGSWHSGTVVENDSHICSVKYHNLLADNSECLVESVEFTPMADVNIPANWSSSTNNRGLIRPLPPRVDIDKCNLPFGLCVDVLHNDAWWEGVIFDHNDGFEERLVFFPDIGDDLRAHFDKLRVTQDWDETTEEWNRRGNWVFLELIMEFKQEWPLLVSVKQIWYEVRMKKGFENLKEWTCRKKSIWKELLLGVVSDNFNLTLKEFFHRINSSGQLEQERLPLLELTEVALDLMIKPSCDSLAVVPIGYGNKAEGVFGTTHSFGKLTQSKCLLKNEWLPADIEAENCPNAITEFNRHFSDGRSSKELVLKARQHISYMGWKIEFSKDMQAGNRFRYTSPTGKRYFSLRKLCEKLTEASFEMIGDRIKNEWLLADTAAEYYPNAITEYYRQYSRGRPSKELTSQARQHLSYMGWKIEFMKDSSGSNIFCYTSPSGKMYFSLNKLCEELTEPSFEIVLADDLIKNEWLPADTAPEYCPYAITEYNRQNRFGRPSKELIPKIRNHLSYMGWKVEVMKCYRHGNRFCYTSPSGKKYFSLNKLCGELADASFEMILSDDEQSQVSEKMLVCKNSCPDSSPSEANVMGTEYCSQDGKGLSHLHSDANALLSGHSNDKHKRCKKRRLDPSLSDPVAVEPEYSLEAVEDYYRMYKSMENADFRKLKRDMALQQMQLNVKKHLVAVNWSIFYTERGERQVLKYSSPSGRSSFTLFDACEICLEEAGITDAYDFKPRRQNLNISRENGSQRSPITESSGTSLSTELADMSKTKEGGVRKLRFKRKNGVFSLDTDWLQREETNSVSQLENQENELGTGGKSYGRVLRSSKRAREVANATLLHQAPRTVLSWLIENNVVLLRAKVVYRSGTDGSTLAEGQVTCDGIKCNCCQSCFSLSNFEAHAGSTNHNPSANILLEDGRSLLDCQIQLRRDMSLKKSRSAPCGPRRLKVKRFHSKNDDICSVCHFGGELILCDQCPSSFHTHCLGLKEVPDGDWFCPSCCCGICGQSRFNGSTEHFTDQSGVNCEQCQHQYHVGCLKEKGHAKLESSPKGTWFCNTRCEEVFLGLQTLLGKPVPTGMDNLTWTLLKYTMSDSSNHNSPDREEVEIYSKLNVALSVMHECFEPVKEHSTKRDLVEDVIFCKWSELNRLNFRGFYTILLEKEDELISVATVRIYGDKVAEVPLVATRFQYRRLGMCRVLMNELEKKLMELGVERLVLPAVPSVLNTWTTSFGFSVMTKLERLDFLDYTFLDFQGTFMCQKLLKGPPQESSMLRGTPLKLCDTAKGTDVIDLDGSSAVSEVLQAERIEESGILDQGSSDIARSDSNEGVIGASPLVVMVDQSTRTECQSVVGMDCVAEAASNKEDDEHNENDNNGNNANFKCYKRRKLAKTKMWELN